MINKETKENFKVMSYDQNESEESDDKNHKTNRLEDSGVFHIKQAQSHLLCHNVDSKVNVDIEDIDTNCHISKIKPDREIRVKTLTGTSSKPRKSSEVLREFGEKFGDKDCSLIPNCNSPDGKREGMIKLKCKTYEDMIKMNDKKDKNKIKDTKEAKIKVTSFSFMNAWKILLDGIHMTGAMTNRTNGILRLWKEILLLRLIDKDFLLAAR